MSDPICEYGGFSEEQQAWFEHLLDVIEQDPMQVGIFSAFYRGEPVALLVEFKDSILDEGLHCHTFRPYAIMLTAEMLHDVTALDGTSLAERSPHQHTWERRQTMIQLGQKVRDRLTKFEGFVVGRVEYLTGCAQVLVQPDVDDKGAWVESRWMDEPRMLVTQVQPFVLVQPDEKPGPDTPAPRR